MINVPKSVCSCQVTIKSVQITQIPTIPSCEETRCSGKESVGLVPIFKTLCPCPVEEVVINYRPQPRRSVVTKVCFEQFIKNITSTKFCDTGPNCKVS